MAKKAKEAVEQEAVEQEAVEQEAVEQEVIELTAEEQAVQDALAADDHLAALSDLRDSDVPSDVLKTVISTFLALTNALGADAPATQHALSNLQNFKSAKVKAAKGPKAPKEPKFNETAELKKVLAEEVPNFQPLLDNDKVSDALKVAITTYTTLASLDGIEQAVVDAAFAALTNFGSKGKRKAPSGPTEEFNVEFDGVTYKNLAAAVYAAGYTKELNDKKQRECDVAWRAIRGKLLAAKIGESVEYDGKSYTKVAPSADAIGGTRGRQKKEESAAEASQAEASQAEESYE